MKKYVLILVLSIKCILICKAQQDEQIKQINTFLDYSLSGLAQSLKNNNMAGAVCSGGMDKDNPDMLFNFYPYIKEVDPKSKCTEDIEKFIIEYLNNNQYQNNKGNLLINLSTNLSIYQKVACDKTALSVINVIKDKLDDLKSSEFDTEINQLKDSLNSGKSGYYANEFKKWMIFRGTVDKVYNFPIQELNLGIAQSKDLKQDLKDKFKAIVKANSEYYISEAPFKSLAFASLIVKYVAYNYEVIKKNEVYRSEVLEWIKGILEDKTNYSEMLPSVSEPQLHMCLGMALMIDWATDIGTIKLLENNLKNECKNPCELANAKYYAIIVGVKENAGTEWAELPNADKEADKVAAILKDNYGFKIYATLKNKDATRINILNSIINLKAQLEKDNSSCSNNILIYFSGHGEKIGSTGYLVPYDCTIKGEKGMANAISYAELENLWKLLSETTQHVLLIADACQSGFAISKGGNKTKLDPSLPNQNSVLEKYYALKSVEIMTASAENEDAKNNVFSSFLIEELSNNNNSVITANEIFQKLKNKNFPRTQTPLYSKEQGQGDFFFQKRKN